jgi:hypothetical protein
MESIEISAIVTSMKNEISGRRPGELALEFGWIAGVGP